MKYIETKQYLEQDLYEVVDRSDLSVCEVVQAFKNDIDNDEDVPKYLKAYRQEEKRQRERAREQYPEHILIIDLASSWGMTSSQLSKKIKALQYILNPIKIFNHYVAIPRARVEMLRKSFRRLQQ